MQNATLRQRLHSVCQRFLTFRLKLAQDKTLWFWVFSIFLIQCFISIFFIYQKKMYTFLKKLGRYTSLWSDTGILFNMYRHRFSWAHGAHVKQFRSRYSRLAWLTSCSRRFPQLHQLSTTLWIQPTEIQMGRFLWAVSTWTLIDQLPQLYFEPLSQRVTLSTLSCVLSSVAFPRQRFFTESIPL